MHDPWVGMTGVSKMSYDCKYCRRSFKKESTLVSHSCERRRRFLQEREIGVQWGFHAYLIFYETTQSANKKTYEQFVDSSYYTAFVRFGRFCHSVHCPNFANYTRWLLKNSFRLDRWCSEDSYSKWLREYIRKESIQDALERSLQSMIDYAHEHPELRNGYRDYFRLVNENRICYNITTGRISPWVVYHSESGQEFVARLNEDQAAMVIDYIDPVYWQAKFKDLPEDVEFVNKVLGMAGL